MALSTYLWAAPPQEAALTIAAAADLAPLETRLASAFERVAGFRPRFSFGSSGTLARQIENGAPFDVYLSADEQLVRELQEKRNVKGMRTYAIGRLVLWSPNAKLRSTAALSDPAVRHISIANPAHAPYGRAARQALERLGIWRQIEPKIVLGENVRQAFEMARSGNADVTIVAATLGGEGAVLLPENLYDPIRQAGAVVSSSSRADMARKFLDFLLSPEGAAVLVSGGLQAPAARRP